MKKINIERPRNRWIIFVVIFVIIAIAAVLILLLCQRREGTYTNAWFVTAPLRFISGAPFNLL